MRHFLLSVLICLPVLSLSAQQSEPSPEEKGREFARETLREKIRFDTAVFRLLPTVGEVRARYAMEAEKGGVEVLAAEREGVVSADQAPESEVHAAINPVDSANIVVSPIRQANGSLLCPIYYSKDFGTSWTKSSYLNLPPHNNVTVLGGGDPVFAFSADGRVYFTWINIYAASNFQTIYSGMFWAYSDDGGATWREEENNLVALDSSSFGGNITLSDKQWMAVDRTGSEWRNRLYVVFVELNSQSGASKIVVRHMQPTSGAMEFLQESVPVSTGNFNLVQFSSIDIDADGYVHVSFFGQHRTQGWGLWHSISQDGGESFSTPNRIAPITFGSTRFGAAVNRSIQGIQDDRLYPAPHIVADRSSGTGELGGGTLYAVWTALGTSGDEGKGYNVYCARSTDNGATWGDPVVVHDDDNGTATDQFYSSVSVNEEGVVAVSWYDKREDVNQRMAHYRVACSFDGGETFGPSVAVTSAPTDFSTIGRQNGDFGVGEYTQVLTTPNYVIPVWSDGRSGNGNMDIYVGFVPIDKASLSVDEPERVSMVDRMISELSLGPNPVSGTESRLRFRLTKGGIVSVAVTDVAGREVMQPLRSEFRAAGEYEVAIPTSELTGGEYFVNVRTSDGGVMRKLTVVR